MKGNIAFGIFKHLRSKCDILSANIVKCNEIVNGYMI